MVKPWAVGTAAVIAVCVSACAAPSLSDAVDDHPAKVTINGSTMYRAVDQSHVDIAVLDAHNPRRLFVLYPEPIQAASHVAGRCPPLLRPFAYVKKETDGSVLVGIGGYRPRAAAPSTTGRSYTLCSTTSTRYRQLPVPLASPLGSREVTSLSSESPATVITDRSVPTPSFIPAGYKPVGLTATLDRQAERRYRHGNYELDIIAGSPTLNRPVQQTSNIRVDNHPVDVFDTQQFRTVSWFVSPHRRIEVTTSVATDAAGQPSGQPGPELSVDDLLRIARSA